MSQSWDISLVRHAYSVAPSLCDSYSEANASNTSYSMQAYAQSFTSDGGKLYSAKFHLSKSGSPLGFVRAQLFADYDTGSGIVPWGYALDSASLDAEKVTTAAALKEFVFPKQMLLSNATYCIVLDYAELVCPTSSDKVYVSIDSTSPTHAGNAAYKSGGSWSVWSNDLIFYTYTYDGDGALYSPTAAFTAVGRKSSGTTFPTRYGTAHWYATAGLSIAGGKYQMWDISLASAGARGGDAAFSADASFTAVGERRQMWDISLLTGARDGSGQYGACVTFSADGYATRYFWIPIGGDTENSANYGCTVAFSAVGAKGGRDAASFEACAGFYGFGYDNDQHAEGSAAWEVVADMRLLPSFDWRERPATTTSWSNASPTTTAWSENTASSTDWTIRPVDVEDN